MKKISISFELEEIKDYENIEDKERMNDWLHRFLRDINVLCPCTSGNDEIKNLEVKVEEIETNIKEKIRCITCNSLNVHKEYENNNRNIYIECLDCNEHELIKKENFNNFKLENFEILKEVNNEK